MREVLGFSEMLENLLFIFFRFGMYFKKIIFLEKNVFWNVFLINFSLKLFDRGSENLIFFKFNFSFIKVKTSYYYLLNCLMW